MKVLLTAFEPFGGEKINPASEILKHIPSKIKDNDIYPLELPTVFYDCLDVIFKEVQSLRPDIIISLGQAGGRFDISVERVAININDASIADNKGQRLVDTAIDSNGSAAYFSTLPIKAIVHKIRETGIPASVSNTAGTFVCNHLMYGVLNYISNNNLSIKSGFIHIPYLPSQVVTKPATPSMELSTMVQAIVAAIEACLENTQDIEVSEGKVC